MRRRQNNSGCWFIDLIGILILFAVIPYVIGVVLFLLACFVIYKIVKYFINKNKNKNEQSVSDVESSIIIDAEPQPKQQAFTEHKQVNDSKTEPQLVDESKKVDINVNNLMKNFTDKSNQFVKDTIDKSDKFVKNSIDKSDKFVKNSVDKSEKFMKNLSEKTEDFFESNQTQQESQQSFKEFYNDHKKLTWAIVSVISVLLLWALTISTFVSFTDGDKNDTRIESSASRKRRSNKESETTTVTTTTTETTTTETTTTETTTTEITTEVATVTTTEATTAQPVITEAPSAPASNFYSSPAPAQPAPAQPAPAQPAPAPQDTYYNNCTAVRNAGAAPIYAGQPGYGRHLDRDGDGVGCEN